MTEDAVPSGKTLYMILGVSRTETPSRIRAAYHDCARELHPDVAGPEAKRAFQELNEAYYELSDPDRRHAYNAAIDAAPSEHRAISILDHPESLHPSFEVYRRFLRNSTGLHVPKAERPVALEVEVLLTGDEATTGCNVPVGVPAFARCPRCRGSGFDWSYPCTACGRSGMIEHERTVHVRIPPMTASGTVYEVALRGSACTTFMCDCTCS